MWFAEVLLALIVALILSFVLVGIFGQRRRGDEEFLAPPSIFLFLILFLATWAGGIWVEPFGPAAYGVVWLPFLLVGLIFAILLMAILPPLRRGGPPPPSEERDAAKVSAAALGGFFWILLVVLAVVIFARYVV